MLLAVEPELARIPRSLEQPCAEVADIPDKALTAEETVSIWARDRQALGVCGRRHEALVGVIKEIEKQINPNGDMK